MTQPPNPNDSAPASVPAESELTESTANVQSCWRREDQAQFSVIPATDANGQRYEIFRFPVQQLADAIVDDIHGGYVYSDPSGADPDQKAGYLPLRGVTQWHSTSIVRRAAPANTDPFDWSGRAGVYWGYAALDPKGPGQYGITLAGSLMLAVQDNGRWWHRTQPVLRNGRIELWHTQLLDTDGTPPIARAVYSAEFSGGQTPHSGDFQFGLSLDPTLRADLVVFSDVSSFGGFSMPTGAPWLEIDFASLSSLGATIAAHTASGVGDWVDFFKEGANGQAWPASWNYLAEIAPPEQPKPSEMLQRWSTSIRFGREIDSKSESTDQLWPFGHRVYVSQAVTRSVEGGLAKEHLVMDRISLVERTVNLTVGPQQPFVSATIVNPELPADGPITIRATDVLGHHVSFQVALLRFGQGAPPPTPISLGGQKLAWRNDASGASTFPTQSIVLTSTFNLRAYPVVKAATIEHPALAALTHASATVTMTLSPDGGDRWATIDGAPTVTTSANLPTRQLGALSTLALHVEQLSASNGAVPAPVPGSGATLPGRAIKLFNLFDLSPLITEAAQVPSISTQDGTTTLTFTAGGTVGAPAVGILKPSVELDGLALKVGLGANREVRATANSLILHLEAGDPTSASAAGLRLPLTAVTFDAVDGQKPSLTAEVHKPEFDGMLSFLNPILSFLPVDVFSNPPAVTVDASGARIDEQLELPAASFGIFELSGLGVEATLDLPFTGDAPGFGFAFPGDGRQFTAGVDGLGGTGSFALNASSQGIVVDAQIGFGGIFAIDLFVISGGVQITGGLHFHHDASSCDVGGYLDITGDVDVMDIASVSIGCHVEIDYDLDSDSFTGTGTISVSVDVLFLSFSKDVGFSVTLGGGGSMGGTSSPVTGDIARLDAAGRIAAPRLTGAPPVSAVLPIRPVRVPAAAPRPFTAAVSQDDWASYCRAFTGGKIA